MFLLKVIHLCHDDGLLLSFFYILDETDEFSKSGLSTSHCACVLNEKALLPSAVFANLQSASKEQCSSCSGGLTHSLAPRKPSDPGDLGST